MGERAGQGRGGVGAGWEAGAAGLDMREAVAEPTEGDFMEGEERRGGETENKVEAVEWGGSNGLEGRNVAAEKF